PLRRVIRLGDHRLPRRLDIRIAWPDDSRVTRVLRDLQVTLLHLNDHRTRVNVPARVEAAVGRGTGDPLADNIRVGYQGRRRGGDCDAGADPTSDHKRDENSPLLPT